MMNSVLKMMNFALKVDYEEFFTWYLHELQYKCQLLGEYPIKSAEVRENCP